MFPADLFSFLIYFKFGRQAAETPNRYLSKINPQSRVQGLAGNLLLVFSSKSVLSIMGKKEIDIEIDRLTNSIENSVTGEVFDTKVVRLDKSGKKDIKPAEWLYDWEAELDLNNREVYKLTTVNNPKIIHGLLCLEDKSDHIFIHLVESANFNKGTNKMYLGVAGNLFAFACKVSFEKGYEGYVAFDSKSALIEHYKNKLGATHFKGQRMYIETVNALKLVKKYFQD